MGDSDHSDAADADLPESGDEYQMMDQDADTEVQVVSPPAKRQAKVPAAQAARDNARKEARWATIISKSFVDNSKKDRYLLNGQVRCVPCNFYLEVGASTGNLTKHAEKKTFCL